MTIENIEDFLEGLPADYEGYFDWDFLKGAFPRGIMPMDMDGQVEINGRFLDFEKKKPDVGIKDGQRRALESRVKTGYDMLLLMRGKNGGPWDVELWYLKDGTVVKNKRGLMSESEIFGLARRWAEWVDSKPAPQYPENFR